MTNQETNIKNIALTNIKVNPNNPRKAFNDSTLEELAISLKTQGVLQPIIVKQTAETDTEQAYEIICGERRFRAAQKAGLSLIPAIVQSDLTDNQYYEMSLTENLQREEISPLEEMLVYTTLIEQKDYTVEKLSVRFGKSESYIRNRMRLVYLIEDFHPLLQSEDINLSTALELCKYTKETQAEIFDEHFATENSYQNWCGKSTKEIARILNNNYSTNLEDFFFDKDECYNCQYNTQVLSLFNDDDICGRCLNGSCLKAKNTAYIIERATEISEQNPELPLARNEYRYDEGAVEELSTKGFDLQIVDYCRECPVPPIANDFETDEEYQAELADFTEETTVIAAKYQSGEINMFALVGNRGVSLCYSGVDAAKQHKHAETPLVKLQSQDKRNAEIAIEKTIADTKEFVRDLDVTQGDFSAFEENLTYFVMLKSLRREHFNLMGVEDAYYLSDEHRFAICQNLTEERKTIIKRDFIIDALGDAFRGNFTATMLSEFAKQHNQEQLTEIENKHQEVYNKRHERILEKISTIEN